MVNEWNKWSDTGGQCSGAVLFWPGSGCSQDGGSGCSQDGGSGSSSSPVVHHLLLNNKVFTNFPSQFTGACFFSKKGTSALLCSSSTLFKETDNFSSHVHCTMYIIVNLVYFFSLKFKV